MTRKRFWRIAVACLVLALAIWACANPLSGVMSQDEEEPAEAEVSEPEEAEEVEEVEETEEPPTPTPVPEPQADLPQVHRNEGAGFSMGLPEEWVVMDFMFITYAAADQEALAQVEGGGEEFTTPVVMAMIAPPEESEMEAGSIEELTEQMIEEDFEPEEGMTISDPVFLTVGGLDASSVDISGTDPETGQDIYARMITIMGPQHAGVFIGASQQSDWDSFEPTFDAIIASVEFFEPDMDAMMEGFGEGFGEEEGGAAAVPDEATLTNGINPGTTVGMTLDDGDIHAWTFEVAAGESVTVTVTPGSDDLDAVVQLISPDGNVLVEMDDGFSGEPEVITYTAAEAGTYTALIRGFAMFGGPYTITLETGGGGGQVSGGELRQWASSAVASSQYSDPDWAASQATGEPDTYPECGDIETAWASAYSDDVSTLTLNYVTPVIPTRMEIYQTYNPGAISQIELIDTSGGSHIIFVGEPKLMDVCPYIMVLSITGVTDPIDQVIIYIDQSETGYWNEIDAVELIGTT